jgi:D-amino peptidase
MRVYISTDIEGITGVVGWSQCGGPNRDTFDFAFARRMYAHDVNAAIRGARAAGAGEVLVKDSHSFGRNLLIEDLDPGAELLSGYSGMPDGMMEGIDGDFDAAVLVGYHAMAGTDAGVMEHALVGGLHRFWLNGKEAGEIEVSAACAAEYGVPLVAVTSDDAGCEEATRAIAGVKTFSTKTGMGKFLAKLKHPSVTGSGIEETVRAAVSARAEIPPHRIDGEVTMRVQFRTTPEAEVPAILPGVRRIDGYTIQWSGSSFAEANRIAQSVYNLSMLGRRLDN